MPEDAARDGWRYTKRVYRPAAHFADDASIESFSFSPEQPGDGAINVELAAYLPHETVHDAFLQCSAGNIATSGHDGFYYQLVEPHMVTRRFLAVAEGNELSCGGAHPANWTVYRTFDRQTGKEVDLYDWIGLPLGEEKTHLLPLALRTAVVDRWSHDNERDDDTCREVVADEDYWSLELTLDGISFTPELPRVVMACGDPVLLTWQNLTSFLDAEGRAGLALLQAK